MSKDWVKDINEMQTKYGVHDWIKKASAEQKLEYLKFRAEFLKEELTELDNAIYHADSEEVVEEGRPNPLGLPDLTKPEDWEAPDHSGNYGILYDF